MRDGTPLWGERTGEEPWSADGHQEWESHGEALLEERALTTPAPAPPATTPGAPAAPALAPPRRGPADPVKALLHRHRELCERAVDPLEIAAGLEAHGMTDRTAARFRHRDVFALAEELYARVPRATDTAPTPAAAAPPPAPGWVVLVLLPGTAAALTAAGLLVTDGTAKTAVASAGAVALALSLTLCLRRGPLRAPGRTAPAAALWVCWLLAYATGGDGLLDQLLTGGPEGLWPLTPAPLLALALSIAPAAWCARLFAAGARRRLARSRGLADFAAVTRPLLLGAVALHLCALAGLLTLTSVAYGAAGAVHTAALGTLLLVARLLTVHGCPEPAARALGAACAAEAFALASVLAARLPGCEFLALPVRAAAAAWGPAVIPTLICGLTAAALLAHATAALSRASAHATP
ncbi:hypothetical protein ACH44C_31395 [Streptomyces purpureus]|uniref:hypothetical protein n=1 Tax=Streptomyces purpureus TaxID=1951 RepID=UPI0037A01978